MNEGPVLIGRQTGASLRIKNAAVSRRHAMIQKDGDKFIIADLDSRNGTFVNDTPVKRCELHHGDRVQIGESQFFFLLEEGDEHAQTSEIRFEDSQILGGSAVRMTYSDALYLMARDLSALMKISTTINSIRGLDELQRRLLDLLFEVVPARRGVILLRASQTGPLDEFVSMTGLDRVSGTTPAINVKFDENHLQLVTAIAAIAAVALENARHIEELQSENERLQRDANIEHSMVGESPLLQKVFQLISKVAPADSTVLISGESGTGKELAARAIHRNSKRADKPFVAVNCAVLAESLLESELFGHEKGAFTGALAQKKGRLEMADRGSMFLDEIGELSPMLQTKLLRVLQEREFERVGGTRTIKIDIRVLAATNRNLEEAIAAGSFRQDLYFRLNVVQLQMPALRERPEDIPLLANYFTRKYAEKCNRKIHGISTEAQRRLMSYDWPGNVRELENAVERAVVLGTSDHILAEDLPEAILEANAEAIHSSTSNYHENVARTKRQMIVDAMKEAKGNYTAAAKALGVHPNYLHRLIRNLNLKSELKS